ncbi:uncharacterized protein LOC112045565 [Bicyclus anynana]|uniref:Uncharacterized protein LOC112045565 n=1 Tax=Bicyclus anynana TaxID=110368 RepID=A0A6J1MSQ8_BICAN|nr:uncharacterized protein LOC112045565 [Bicyclus anynana]
MRLIPTVSIPHSTAKMKILCLLLFGFWLAIAHGQNIPSSPSFATRMHQNLRPLKRVARQDIPPPPDGIPPPPEDIPPPPGMLDDHQHSLLRKKREARGVGGSLPTRKG